MFYVFADYSKPVLFLGHPAIQITHKLIHKESILFFIIYLYFNDVYNNKRVYRKSTVTQDTPSLYPLFTYFLPYNWKVISFFQIFNQFRFVSKGFHPFNGIRRYAVRIFKISNLQLERHIE